MIIPRSFAWYSVSWSWCGPVLCVPNTSALRSTKVYDGKKVTIVCVCVCIVWGGEGLAECLQCTHVEPVPHSVIARKSLN